MSDPYDELAAAYEDVFRSNPNGLRVLQDIARAAKLMQVDPSEGSFMAEQHVFRAGQRSIASYIFNKCDISVAELLKSQP